ncbi:MAG: 2-oxoglutarate dehydrogenase, partial [Clostridiales bacterium]|nr:2-oxoglutarate dehydrogenase [Clostridiales bacterium]
MKRSDGVLLKSLDPFTKIIPYVMDKRTESQNFSKQVIKTDGIDSYISEKGKQGYRFSYLHVFIAAYVRLFAERPNLNRFIVN